MKMTQNFKDMELGLSPHPHPGYAPEDSQTDIIAISRVVEVAKK